MKKITAFTIAFFALCSSTFSQDLHFSQFYLAPMLENPGNTGVFTLSAYIESSYDTEVELCACDGIWQKSTCKVDFFFFFLIFRFKKYILNK